MKFSLYQPLAIHELGQRANQEDNIYPQLGRATAADRLFIVCDGMGGHERGEVASSIVCQAIPQYFQQAGISPDKGLSDDDLRNAIEYAFLQLDRADDGAIKKMGTTLTLLYMHRAGVTCAHIGDSRIYHIRSISSPKIGKAWRGLNGGLLFQSRDHSLVYDLYQAGEIAYEEMRTSTQKNIITRAMQPGEDNRVRADIVHITNVQPGDYFYLCTDGMLEEMENDELVNILSSNQTDEAKRQHLIEATKNNHDNHSAYIIHVKEVMLEVDDENNLDDEGTSRFNACNIHPQLIPTDDEDVSIVEEYPEKKVVPPSIPQQKPIVKTKPVGKNKKLLSLVLLAFLLIVAFIGYGAFKSEKKAAKEDTSLVVPLHRPRPMYRHHVPQSPPPVIGTSEKAVSNKATKDSSAISKDSLNNRGRNGQQQ